MRIHGIARAFVKRSPLPLGGDFAKKLYFVGLRNNAPRGCWGIAVSLKAFRLFVSSTFADFELEREILQHQVFPELDAYCAVKGYQFYPLDLRWGVSEEAQLDQRTAEICLGEVRAALTPVTGRNRRLVAQWIKALT